MSDKPAKPAPKGEPGRPAKRPARPAEKPKSSLPIILLAVGVVAFLVLVGGGVGVYFLLQSPKKETPVASVASQPTGPTMPTMPADPGKTSPGTTPTMPSTPVGPGMGGQGPSMPTYGPSGGPGLSGPGLNPPTGPGMTAPGSPNPTTKPNPPPPPPPPFTPRPAPPPKPPIVKKPVPSSSDLARAETALKDAYKEDYKKTQPPEKLAFAAKLLQPGRENRNDPAAWFVLLREARDLSIQAGRPRLAVETISEMDRYFIVDALDMKIKALADTSKSGKDADVAASYRVGLNLIQQAYDAENFAAAKRIIDIVEPPVREAKQTDLLKLVQIQQSEIEAYTQEFQAVTSARAKLKATPDDPIANLAVGKYLCFFQGDWEHGLPMLAKGADPALKELAKKDLAGPADVKGRMAVADAWWNWSTTVRDREQRHLVKHARGWYEKAGPASTGQDRTTIIARLQAAQRKEYDRIRRLQPGSYYGRDIENRTLLLREGGGTMKSEEAVERGLEWLAAHQFKSDQKSPQFGAWLMENFKKGHANCNCGDHGEKHDVAGTALALLPFLGAGNTHKAGPYHFTVDHGLKFLLKQQKQQTGNFHDNAYENALASIVVIELYGLTKDPALRRSAQFAVNYIIQSQFNDGSWGYSANTKGDTSVAGWQFTALKAAAYAKLEVSTEAFDRLSRFLDIVAAADGTGYGYNTPGNGPATSAVGILCREFLSWGPGHPGLLKEIDFLLRPDQFPTKDKISIYSVFYQTQVAHHFGSYYWDQWNERTRDVLIELQDQGDNPKASHQKGSWTPPPGEPHAKAGGRLMYTALALVTLETYYYHIPLYAYGPYTLMD
ncbi:MAG: hypothetical protein ACJ8F7_23645 [Gemmataceae bacterium]